MTTYLNEPTLVLNKNWRALLFETAKEAIVKTFTGCAKIIDEDCLQYTWNEWMGMSLDEPNKDGAHYIITTAGKIRVPEVILLLDYSQIPHINVKLTRRNLLIRDNFRCVYTNKTVTSHTATMDHVIPKSRGGKTEWTNLVICSFDANVKKGNRTPQEAGLPVPHPKKPHWSLKYSKHIPGLPKTPKKSWSQFINTDQWNDIGYWDVELID